MLLHCSPSLQSGLIQRGEKNRESTEGFHFLNARNEVPLKSEFKPAVKVLSRKPTPKQTTRTDCSSGLSQLTLDDYEDNEDGQGRSNQGLTADELRQKTQREREEKQRRYDEARERLFGSSSSSATATTMSSGTATPGDVTPPISSAGNNGGEEDTKRRTRGRNSGKSGRDKTRTADQGGSNKKQLFDPSYTVKPDSVYIQRRDTESQTMSSEEEEGQPQQPIRAPRGPDGSGRGGFGFSGGGKRGS